MIAELITATLARSPHLSAAEVVSALNVAKPAGLMLIAAGHLERDGLVLVAGKLHLSITVISGGDAFSGEENLEPVPGAADARDWVIYLPTPEPIGDAIVSIAASDTHLSSAQAPTEAPADATSLAANPSAELNLQALAAREARR